jgi:cellulose synthase operon protein C
MSVRPSAPRCFRRPLNLLGILAASIALIACSADKPADLLARATALETQGDLRGAMVQFKSALQADPAAKAARLGLGRVLLRLGDHDAAVVELQRALAEGATPSEAQPLLATALVRSGDFKRAVHAIANMGSNDKLADAVVQTQLAFAWLSLGEEGKGGDALARASQLDPANREARLLRLRLDARTLELDELERRVDALIADHPNFSQALQLKAEILSARGRRKEALAVAGQAVAADPSNLASQGTVVQWLLMEGDLAQAKRQHEAMRAVSAWHPSTALAEIQIAMAEGNWTSAREKSQKLLSVLPDHELVLATAGFIEARAGSPVQALGHMRRALIIQPTLDGARIELAATEVRLGQYVEALQTLRPLLAGANPSVGALSLASDAEMKLGRFKQADELLQRASAAAPNDIRLQTARLVRQISLGASSESLAALQSLTGKSKDTVADEALFAARMARGEYGEALRVLDTIAAKDPGRAAVNELRGRVHLARSDLPAARAAFEAALKADPALFGAVSSLVSLDLLENRHDRAIARVQAVVDRDPGNSVALMALAELKGRHGGSYEDSVKLLLAAVNASPSADEPRLKLIQLALRTRRHKEALSYAQEAVAALPGNPRLLDALGQAQIAAGEVEQAVASFRAMAGASSRQALPYIRLARVYALQGKRDAAQAALQSALEAEPTNAEAKSGLVDLWMASKQEDKALEFVRRQRQLRPNDPAGYGLEASYHMRSRAPEKALTVLREGVSKTDSSELASQLFSLLLRMERDGEAGSFGAAWLRRHPRDATIEYLMSVRDIARNDLPSAQERLKRVVASYPTNALALNNLAWVTVKTGGKGGVEYARRAVSVAPETPDYMDTLAMALGAEGQLKEAMDIQRRALDLSPNQPELRLGMARLALKAGDKEVARGHLQALEKLGAGFAGQAEAEELRKRL